MTNLEHAFQTIEHFSTPSRLTTRIAEIESKFKNKNKDYISEFLSAQGINNSMILAALNIKHVAGQINVLIHAIGILVALPFILESDEEIEYLSLGAGNTGKEFDLETNKRIAEFKFTNWHGGPETIRQNTFFKDFFTLAEYETDKRRFLYVINKEYPLKFLNNKRALSSVLSKNHSVRKKFYNKHGDKYTVVSQYYNDFKNIVEIVDIKDIVTLFNEYEF